MILCQILVLYSGTRRFAPPTNTALSAPSERVDCTRSDERCQEGCAPSAVQLGRVRADDFARRRGQLEAACRPDWSASIPLPSVQSDWVC